MNMKSGSYFDQTLTVLLTVESIVTLTVLSIYSDDAPIDRGSKSDYQSPATHRYLPGGALN